MNIYFACSSKGFDKYLVYYELVWDSIKTSGHKIIGDWVGRSIQEKRENKKYSIPNIRDEAILAIDESDLLIADVSIPSASVGYQVAYALSKKKAVLCLYSIEFGSKKIPQVISATGSSYLKISGYNKKNIKKIVKEFFNNIPSQKLIKFNFIITPEIDNFLEWGSSKYSLSKSEFLRREVEKVIEAKSEYKR